MPAITYKSDLLTSAAAVAYSDKIVSSPTRGAKLRYIKATYQIPASSGTQPVTTDIIQLCKLPPGAVLDPSLSTVWNQLVHTACNLDIGCDGATADPDRYADGIDVKGANALVSFASTAVAAAQLTPYKTPTEVTVSATFAGTVTLNTATSKLVFNIAYWIEG